MAILSLKIFFLHWHINTNMYSLAPILYHLLMYFFIHQFIFRPKKNKEPLVSNKNTYKQYKTVSKIEQSDQSYVSIGMSPSCDCKYYGHDRETNENTRQLFDLFVSVQFFVEDVKKDYIKKCPRSQAL